MNHALLQIVRPLVPARCAHWWRRHFGWQWFRGDYPDWAAARAASAGYDDAAVLARVVAAVREVQAGRAAWERDGVAFAVPEVNAPLLGALQNAAGEAGGHLDVVDFGGALGSTWWQHRAVLRDLRSLRWRVVEQPHYVAAGAEFAGDGLSFHGSIEQALGGDAPAVIVLSSVLPYVESPAKLLEEVARRNFPRVIIDRTPLVRAGATRLVVQHTPPQLGGGSYPCWLFERTRVLAPLLQGGYRLVGGWPALDDLAPEIEHRGFLLQRNNA